MTVRPGPTTTQADLDKLGFKSDKIKNKLKEMRGGTLTEVHINDPFCTSYQWRLQNAVLGAPVRTSETPADTECVRIMQHYDNSMNQQDASMTTFDTRTNTLRQALIMEELPKIKLGAKIEFPSQTDGLDIPPELAVAVPILDTEEACGFGSREKNEEPLTFDMRISPGEAVELWKISCETGSDTTWEIPYGFQGKVGTHGKVWQDCEDIAFSFASAFPNPPQKLHVSFPTRLTKVTYMLMPGTAQITPQRSADWHPTSTVTVINARTKRVHEFRLGEVINF